MSVIACSSFSCVGDEVLGREDVDVSMLLQDFAGQRIDTQSCARSRRRRISMRIRRFAVGGHDLHRIAAHAERAALQVNVVALI